jgi:hypothetical protein
MKKYGISCFLCGTTKDLMMFAHRQNKTIVGWLFSCSKCHTLISNKLLEITIKGKKTHELKY